MKGSHNPPILGHFWSSGQSVQSRPPLPPAHGLMTRVLLSSSVCASVCRLHLHTLLRQTSSNRTNYFIRPCPRPHQPGDCGVHAPLGGGGGQAVQRARAAAPRAGAGPVPPARGGVAAAGPGQAAVVCATPEVLWWKSDGGHIFNCRFFWFLSLTYWARACMFFSPELLLILVLIIYLLLRSFAWFFLVAVISENLVQVVSNGPNQQCMSRLPSVHPLSGRDA